MTQQNIRNTKTKEQQMGTMMDRDKPQSDEPEVETGEQVNPEPVAESAPEEPGVRPRYFINEDGAIYPWLGSVEDQTREFPDDDHTPHDTFADALKAVAADLPLPARDEQDARIGALNAARDLLTERREKGAFNGAIEVPPNVIDLITLADYIVTGEQSR